MAKYDEADVRTPFAYTCPFCHTVATIVEQNYRQSSVNVPVDSSIGRQMIKLDMTTCPSSY